MRLQRRRAAGRILRDREDDVLAVLRDRQRRERIGRAARCRTGRRTRCASPCVATSVRLASANRTAIVARFDLPDSWFLMGAPSWSRLPSRIDDADSLVVGVGDVDLALPSDLDARTGRSSSAAVAGPSSPAKPGWPQRPAKVAMIPSGVTTRTQSLSLSAMKRRPSARDRDVGERGRAARPRRDRRRRRSPTCRCPRRS